MTRFEKYKDAKGEWRWTFYASNGEALAVSSEGYVHEADCDHSIDLVEKSAGSAKVIVTK